MYTIPHNNFVLFREPDFSWTLLEVDYVPNKKNSPYGFCFPEEGHTVAMTKSGEQFDGNWHAKRIVFICGYTLEEF